METSTAWSWALEVSIKIYLLKIIARNDEGSYMYYFFCCHCFLKVCYYDYSLFHFYLSTFADSSAFWGKADFNYQLDNYTRFKMVEEVLREYVSLVNVRRRRDEVSLQVINPEQKQVFAGPPLNLLDGIPLSDFSKLTH
ncbi:MAG TPA: hypothetical protein VL943_00185 [Niabella sp.]|nr:hypothetical protein [Niabella sp.]